MCTVGAFKADLGGRPWPKPQDMGVGSLGWCDGRPAGRRTGHMQSKWGRHCCRPHSHRRVVAPSRPALRPWVRGALGDRCIPILPPKRVSGSLTGARAGIRAFRGFRVAVGLASAQGLSRIRPGRPGSLRPETERSLTVACLARRFGCEAPSPPADRFTGPCSPRHFTSQEYQCPGCFRPRPSPTHSPLLRGQKMPRR